MVKRRFSSASASISSSGHGPDRWWIGFDALHHVYARLSVHLDILGLVGP
jgi:hypothetical protein